MLTKKQIEMIKQLNMECCLDLSDYGNNGSMAYILTYTGGYYKSDNVEIIDEIVESIINKEISRIRNEKINRLLDESKM